MSKCHYKKYLKNKLHTLKENENMTKYIHLFHALIEQLWIASVPIPNDEVVLSLMWNMPQNSRNIISFMNKQQWLSLYGICKLKWTTFGIASSIFLAPLWVRIFPKSNCY